VVCAVDRRQVLMVDGHDCNICNCITLPKGLALELWESLISSIIYIIVDFDLVIKTHNNKSHSQILCN
jgi:hypothetical protein